MAIVLIILLLIIGTFFALKQKNYCNLLTFNFYYWALIIFLASLKLFDMMDYSNKAYYVLLIGILGILFGYIIGFYAIPKLKKRRNKIEYFYNKSIIRVISIINIVFYLYEGIKVLNFLKNGTSYYFIRRMYQGYEEISFFTNSLEAYFSSYIAIPIAYLLSIYIVLSFFKDKKIDKTLLLSIISIMLYIFVSANRIIMIQMLICFIYMFFFFGKKIPKKVKKGIIRIGGLMVVSILLVSIFKENKVNGSYYDWGFLKGLYSYFSIPIPLLDHWVKYVDNNSFYSFGVTFFRAPLNIINMLFLKPLKIDFSLLNETINYINVTDSFVRVFPRHEYNAFATMFYYFYLDFRELGVLIGSIIWGIICGKVYYNSSNIQSDKNLAFLLLCIYALIKSMVRWELSSPSFFMALLLMRFLFKKHGGNSNEESS